MAIAERRESPDRIILEVLPLIRAEIDLQRNDIKDELAIVRLAMKKYDETFQKFCVRLADHEQRLQRLEANGEHSGGYRPGTASPDPNFTYGAEVRYSPVFLH